jgi:hypothetical protein
VNCESDVLSESSEKKIKAQERESKGAGGRGLGPGSRGLSIGRAGPGRPVRCGAAVQVPC